MWFFLVFGVLISSSTLGVSAVFLTEETAADGGHGAWAEPRNGLLRERGIFFQEGWRTEYARRKPNWPGFCV